MDVHRERVDVIAAEVQYFYNRRIPFRIYHGTTHSTHRMAFQRDSIIDTSHLSHVVRVDRFKRKALVEPNVSMEQLVDLTLQSGLIPQVTMDFPGLTCGGGFAGNGRASNSFKYGNFEKTVTWIEIILGDGKRVTASPTDKPDLFEGVAGTLGTLGVITLLEVQLVKAKKFVQLTYLPVNSVTEAVKELERATSEAAVDYLDGILFSPEKGVIMTGQLTDVVEEEIEIVQFSRPSDQWFYEYAEAAATDPNLPKTTAIPLIDYLFRYDRGVFWAGRYALNYVLAPVNHVTRYFLDSFLRARPLFHALHESGLANSFIVQDIALHSSAAQHLIDYLHHTFGFYPLWLCPLRGGAAHPLHARKTSVDEEDRISKEMLLNIGVWGPGPTTAIDSVIANRNLEKKIQELSGLKSLYARAYYTEDEFWDVYDRQQYDSLRAKYNANTLASLYDKVRTDLAGTERASGIWSTWPFKLIPGFWEIWPTAGVYGGVRAFMGLYLMLWGDYIMAKPTWKEYIFAKK
jgi:Delta24-sterol reductase